MTFPQPTRAQRDALLKHLDAIAPFDEREREAMTDARTRDFEHLRNHIARMLRKWPDEIGPEEQEPMRELLGLISERFAKERAMANDARGGERI